MYEALVQQLLEAGTEKFLPQSDEELWEYIYRELGYAIPRVAVCRDHQSAFSFIADAYFERVYDAIVVGPRAGGKTLGLGILDVLLMEHLGVTICNVGAIEKQAKKCYAYIDAFVRLPQFRANLLKPPMLSATFLKNGGMVEVLAGTMQQVNSPHHNRLHWDEIELADPAVLEESKAIPIRQKGRPPATIWTSSRKRAYGPMEDMLTSAGKKGIPVYKYCVMDVAEKCPPERHADGKGCEDAMSVGYPAFDPDTPTCPLFEVCKEKEVHIDGSFDWLPGPGRLARAEGWMEIDDIITQFKSMDRVMFDSQMLSLRPVTHGLAFPMFDDQIHVIDYDYNPAFPVVCGIDFGYTHPNVALYAQPTPGDEVVIFAEDFKQFRTAVDLAESMKREPWFTRTRWRVGDSAARGDREILNNFGVTNEPAAKEGTEEEPSSRKATCDLVRYLLEPPGRKKPLLFIARRCENTIRQVKRYHYPEDKPDADAKEIAVKVDDDAVDALRYLCKRLYRGSIAV